MRRYLVTGATGFLGRAVVSELLAGGATVRALVLREDPLRGALPAEVETVFGDVCDAESLTPFFRGAGDETCLIHAAGIVSVATRPEERLYRVNVEGTRNILRLCRVFKTARLVYVSSVHAIPESEEGGPASEPDAVSPEYVRGHYAKSKAMATRLVMEAYRTGLNAGIVYPSGIIGPGDVQKGSVTAMLEAFLRGRLPAAVAGGYDFADVRDVAAGTVACARMGKRGGGYILSGHHVSIRQILETAGEAAGQKRAIRCLPLALAKQIAPLCERNQLRRGERPYFTPYAVSVLASRGLFSREAAGRDLGYFPRPMEITVRDTVRWLERGTSG